MTERAASNGWISVAERLPDLDTAVLVAARDAQHVAWLIDAERLHWERRGGALGSVSHWMPLPKPPEGS